MPRARPTCHAFRPTAPRRCGPRTFALGPLLAVALLVPSTAAAFVQGDLSSPGESALALPQLAQGNAVEEGRDALQQGARPPWYDAERDELRRINVKPRAKPPTAKGQTADPLTSSGSNFNTGGGFNVFSILMWAGIVGIAIILLALVAAVVYAMVNQDAALDEETEGGTDYNLADRMEQLPFDVRKPLSNLLEEARRLSQQGRYSEAIVYLYSYLLVQLDKSHVIRLTRGKTNRQYLYETRRCPPLDKLLEPTMIAFEDAFFGHHTIDRMRFESCWRQLDAFEQQLQQLPA